MLLELKSYYDIVWVSFKQLPKLFPRFSLSCLYIYFRCCHLIRLSCKRPSVEGVCESSIWFYWKKGVCGGVLLISLWWKFSERLFEVGICWWDCCHHCDFCFGTNFSRMLRFRPIDSKALPSVVSHKLLGYVLCKVPLKGFVQRVYLGSDSRE